MSDSQLLSFCFAKFRYDTFTGNDIVRCFKSKNHIHLQLFRLFNKKKLNKFTKSNQTYYFIKDTTK
jgi:hypothetical protein